MSRPRTVGRTSEIYALQYFRRVGVGEACRLDFTISEQKISLSMGVRKKFRHYI